MYIALGLVEPHTGGIPPVHRKGKGLDKVLLDQVFGIDRRAIAALMRLGVIPGGIDASSEGPFRWVFRFSFSGDRELAKYHVHTFLSDEYGATNVQFFASAKNARHCYAKFTPRKGYEHGK